MKTKQRLPLPNAASHADQEVDSPEPQSGNSELSGPDSKNVSDQNERKLLKKQLNKFECAAWKWHQARSLSHLLQIPGKEDHNPDHNPLFAVGWQSEGAAFAVFPDGSVCVRVRSKYVVERTCEIAFRILRIDGDDRLVIRLAHLVLGHLPAAFLRKPAFSLPPEAYSEMKPIPNPHAFSAVYMDTHLSRTRKGAVGQDHARAAEKKTPK